MRTALLVAGCLAVGGMLWAETPPCTQVAHSGMLVLRMRVGLGDRTPQDRAVEVHRQLVRAMSVLLAEKRDLDPSDVVVRYAGGRPYHHEVWFRDLRLVGVTQADADASGCCTQQLASRWAKNLRRVLYEATHDC